MTWKTQIFSCVWSAGHLRPVYGPLCFPSERKWTLRQPGHCSCLCCKQGCFNRSTTGICVSCSSFFSPCGSCLSGMCWAVACLQLMVLLRNKWGQLWSERRFGESIVIREDALVRRNDIWHCSKWFIKKGWGGKSSVEGTFWGGIGSGNLEKRGQGGIL